MRKVFQQRKVSSLKRNNIDYGKISFRIRKSFIMRREFDYAKGNSNIRGKFDYEKGVPTRKNNFYHEKEVRFWKRTFYKKKTQ